MGSAITANITVLQGSRYQGLATVSVEWLTDLTGYSARGTVRRFQTVDVLEDPLAVLDTYLTVNAPGSMILIDIPANVSATWDWRKGRFDIEIFDGNPAHDVRVLEGVIKVNTEVTR